MTFDNVYNVSHNRKRKQTIIELNQFKYNMVNKLYQKIQQTDLKNACRLCLAEEASFVDICSTKIRSMIEDCCDIKVLVKIINYIYVLTGYFLDFSK